MHFLTINNLLEIYKLYIYYSGNSVRLNTVLTDHVNTNKWGYRCFGGRKCPE